MPDHTIETVDGAVRAQAIGAGNLMLPGAGAWTMEALLSAPSAEFAVGQQVAVTLADVRRVGTIVRFGADYMQARLRIVGGAGGLDKVQPARDYRGYTADRIAVDILRDAGERPGLGWTAFSTYCPHWSRVTAAARDNLRRVMRLTREYQWRCDRDGSIALYRTGDYSASPAEDFYDRDEAIYPQEGLAVLAPATTGLEPGQTATIFGVPRQVDRVVYRIGNESMRLRADVWFV